jgi:hypothetical protein
MEPKIKLILAPACQQKTTYTHLRHISTKQQKGDINEKNSLSK